MDGNGSSGGFPGHSLACADGGSRRHSSVDIDVAATCRGRGQCVCTVQRGSDWQCGATRLDPEPGLTPGNRAGSWPVPSSPPTAMAAACQESACGTGMSRAYQGTVEADRHT